MEHPDVMRLMAWSSLEKDTDDPGSRRAARDVKIAALAAAQSDGRVRTSFSPAFLLTAIISEQARPRPCGHVGVLLPRNGGGRAVWERRPSSDGPSCGAEGTRTPDPLHAMQFEGTPGRIIPARRVRPRVGLAVASALLNKGSTVRQVSRRARTAHSMLPLAIRRSKKAWLRSRLRTQRT
jgi:hypothetical protein